MFGLESGNLAEKAVLERAPSSQYRPPWMWFMGLYWGTWSREVCLVSIERARSGCCSQLCPSPPVMVPSCAMFAASLNMTCLTRVKFWHPFVGPVVLFSEKVLVGDRCHTDLY